MATDCRRDDYSDAIKISGDNPVRLYIEGTIKIDRYTWIDTTDVNHAADFMILGSTNSTTNLDLVGISPDEEAMKAFIWLPNGRVKINAVRNQKRVLEGAIWAENFWAEGNALLGTTDIFVPEDMPQLIYQRLGQEFGIGQRDYVAQGVTSWQLWANKRLNTHSFCLKTYRYNLPSYIFLSQKILNFLLSEKNKLKKMREEQALLLNLDP